MVYPKEHYVTPSQTRSIILVNRWLASDTWSQVDIRSSDVTAIAINTGIGKVLLINMYNDIGQQHGLTCSIPVLHERQQVGEPESHVEQAIWVGDFNLHHSLWDEGHNRHLFTRGNLEKSQVLIYVID